MKRRSGEAEPDTFLIFGKVVARLWRLTVPEGAGPSLSQLPLENVFQTKNPLGTGPRPGLQQLLHLVLSRRASSGTPEHVFFPSPQCSCNMV